MDISLNLRLPEIKFSESLKSSASFSSYGSEDEELSNLVANFDINDMYDEDEFVSTNGEKSLRHFKISIHDMDTGLIHTLNDLKCIQASQDYHKKSRYDACLLSLPSEKFLFKSCKRLHGMKADEALNTHWGTKYDDQSLNAKNFNVYKGEMAFTFQFPICYPKSSVNETQWCL